MNIFRLRLMQAAILLPVGIAERKEGPDSPVSAAAIQFERWFKF
jgi:hypothetical protein